MKIPNPTARNMRRGSILLLLLSVPACTSDAEGPDRVAPAPVSVTVSTAVRADAGLDFAGSVVADRRARVSTRTSGNVREVLVDVGARVRAGDVLARLDASDLTARLEAAEAEQRVATVTFERIRNLAADGAASRQELDEARTRMERADATVREVRAQFDYTTVRAPFDGTVEARHVDPGDLASPGVPLLTLVDPTAPRIVVDLPPNTSVAVDPGHSIGVLHPESGWTGDARVTRVSPALDPTTRRLRVEAEFTSPTPTALRPGTFVRVLLPSAGASTLWLPADAVVRRGQLTGVFTVESDTLRLRWLRLGRTTADAVEVLAGPGDSLTVVRAPSRDLADGTPVGEVAVRAWTPAVPVTRASGAAR